MWPSFRVRAPAYEHSAELSWVLSRAFATVSEPVAVDGLRVLALSEQLDLTARIAVRHELGLAGEIGETAARQMAFRRLETIALEQVLGRATLEVCELAASRGLSLILIKHAALRRAALVPSGARFARDVDVLVPKDQAQELQSALIERGFRGATFAPAFHLPTLTRGPGEAVEIHHLLWGLKAAGSAVATGLTAEAMIAAGLTTSTQDGLLVPTREVLAAHAVVHGLVQHRTSPDGYPPMRAIADLVDVGLFGPGAEDRCAELLARSDNRPVLCAALRLAQRLKERPIADVDTEASERQMLSHLIAVGNDEAYQSALRFERIFEPRELNGVWPALKGVFRKKRSTGATSTDAKRSALSDLFAQGASYFEAQFRRRGR